MEPTEVKRYRREQLDKLWAEKARLAKAEAELHGAMSSELAHLYRKKEFLVWKQANGMAGPFSCFIYYYQATRAPSGARRIAGGLVMEAPGLPELLPAYLSRQPGTVCTAASPSGCQHIPADSPTRDPDSTPSISQRPSATSQARFAPFDGGGRLT